MMLLFLLFGFLLLTICQTQIYPLEDVAIVVLSVGDRAKAFTETFLLSFCRNAKWRGPVFIITEEKEYFTGRKIWNEHAAEVDIRIIEIEQDEGLPLTEKLESVRMQTMSADHATKAPRQGPGLSKNVHMRVKLLKARLFEIVSDYEYIVYMDSDLIIGKPLEPFFIECLSTMISPERARNGTAPNVDTAIALFPDIGISKAPYHTGVVFMSRTNSERLLRGWKQRIASGKFKKDQWAFKHAVEHMRMVEQVRLLPVSPATNYFAFINGTIFRKRLKFTILHATLYRLTQPHRPEWKFSFEDAKAYFVETLNIPFLYDFVFEEMEKRRNKVMESS